MRLRSVVLIALLAAANTFANAQEWSDSHDRELGAGYSTGYLLSRQGGGSIDISGFTVSYMATPNGSASKVGFELTHMDGGDSLGADPGETYDVQYQSWKLMAAARRAGYPGVRLKFGFARVEYTSPNVIGSGATKYRDFDIAVGGGVFTHITDRLTVSVDGEFAYLDDVTVGAITLGVGMQF